MQHTQPASPTTSAERRALARAERRTAAAHSRVPLSVWLTEPLTGCCPVCATPEHACANRVPGALADQLVEAYSKPGDLVYVPDAGNAALMVAAVRAGRKVLAYTHAADHARSTQQTMRDAGCEVASLAVLRRADPATLPTQAERLRGRAQLAVLAPHHPVQARALAAMAEACARVLRPSGVLAILSRQSSSPDLTGHLVTHGQAAGMTYLQHIAAVEATAHGDELVMAPAAPVGVHSPDCTCRQPAHRAGRHLLVHNDITVLQRP
ncbi:hypothetical protein [Streptacidiphilus sp. MAP5-3]|uniref:hypothetical protein n=1 Tax=unclassified Streptacidiphilus TaxID=2643834 RepID=UPI003514BB76